MCKEETYPIESGRHYVALRHVHSFDIAVLFTTFDNRESCVFVTVYLSVCLFVFKITKKLMDEIWNKISGSIDFGPV